MNVSKHNCSLLILLILLITYVQAQQHPLGHPSCPCIDPWNSQTNHYLCKRKNSNNECYADSYGASACLPHSIIYNETQCTGEITTNNDLSYCKLSWCFVDPDNCHKPNVASSFFDQQANSTQYYSYETCGNLDSYTVFDSVFDKFKGGKIRVQVPGDDSVGVMTYEEFKTTGFTYGVKNSFKQYGKHGHALTFMEDVLESLEIYSFEVVPRSEDSLAFSPGSSFTACIHDIALNNTDICVGNFWTTEYRQQIPGYRFTQSTFQDHFRVLSRQSGDSSGSFLSVGLATKPFEKELWILVLLMLLVMGLCKWLIEGWDNDDDYPTKDRVDSLSRSVFFAFQAFFGNGDFKETPFSSEGQLSFLSFAFCISVLLTAYVAQMTTILSRAETISTEYKDLDDAIDKGAYICAMTAIRPELRKRYPKLSRAGKKLVGFESAGHALEAMEGGFVYGDTLDESAIATVRSDWDSASPDGYCDVAIVAEMEFRIMQTGAYSNPADFTYFASDLFKERDIDSAAAHCDKQLLDGITLSIDNAYAVSLELSYPLGYAVAKAKATGAYGQAIDAAFNTLPNDVCETKANENVSDSLKWEQLFGILFITTLVSILCVVYHYLKVYLTKGDRFVKEPGLRNRLFGYGEGAEKKFGGDPQSNYVHANREARLKAREELSFDLTMVGDALHSRHKVANLCAEKGIKADSPLTLSDIPSLFKTMLMMLSDTNIKEDFKKLYVGDLGKGNNNARRRPSVAKTLFGRKKKVAPARRDSIVRDRIMGGRQLKRKDRIEGGIDTGEEKEERE